MATYHGKVVGRDKEAGSVRVKAAARGQKEPRTFEIPQFEFRDAEISIRKGTPVTVKERVRRSDGCIIGTYIETTVHPGKTSAKKSK